MDEEHFANGYAWSVEGARIAFVVCKKCGAGLFLSMAADSMAIHKKWHEDNYV